MNIAIDARQYGPQGTGIGKYTEKLIEGLQKIDKKNTYYIILRKDNWYFFNPKNTNFEKVMVDARFYSLKEQALLPAALLKLKPDFVHFTHFNVPLLFAGKFVVTIHDIITKEFSGTSTTSRALPVYLLKRGGYQITLGQTIRRAKKIIVPSISVQKKIQKDFPSSEKKISVIYEGVSSEQTKTSARSGKILPKYGIKKPYFLYVGSCYPHKNVESLVSALKFLDKKYQLVLVGERNIFLERVLKIAKVLGVEDRIVAPGFVPSEELAVLYRQATCFTFPSFSEGFGLPGLEAMVVGCPVAASNIPVFKEIYEDAAIYFDPKDPGKIAEMVKAIAQKQKRDRMVKKGFKQIDKYRWEKTAQETLEVYKQLA